MGPPFAVVDVLELEVVEGVFFGDPWATMMMAMPAMTITAATI
jgi:hypothetical protein